MIMESTVQANRLDQRLREDDLFYLERSHIRPAEGIWGNLHYIGES